MLWIKLAGGLALVLLTYLILVALLFFSQDMLLYQNAVPTRALVATPAQIDLIYEDVWLQTEDEVTLHAWWLPRAHACGTVLFFHGNAGNISHRLDTLRIFAELNLNVLILDYRGYGQSQGRPSEQGTYLDAQAAWRYLTEVRQIPAVDILLFGRSLGAAVAAWLAARTDVSGLVLESGFSSLSDLAAQLYPFVPVRELLRFNYDSRAQLAKVSSAVLIIHSRDDEIIPFSHGQALYEAAGAERKFVELRGSHNEGFLLSRDAYLVAWRAFLDELHWCQAPIASINRESE